MSRKPSTHRVDGNQAAIVEVAAALGWEALSLTSLGGGAPDLLLWSARNGFRLAECKNGRRARFRASQRRFRDQHRMPVLDLWSADQAQETLLAIMRAEGGR